MNSILNDIFDGTVSRQEYWKYFFLSAAYLLLFALAVRSLTEILGYDSQNGIIIVYTAGSIIWLMWFVTVMVRRARDAGNVIAWTLIALLTPLGFITVGLAPSKNK